MQAEELIVQALAADSAVLGIIGQASQLVPLQKLDTALPHVVYSRIATKFNNTGCVDEDISGFAFMQVDCWAADYATAKALYKAVRSALLRNGAIINNYSDFQDEQAENYCAMADYQIAEA